MTQLSFADIGAGRTERPNPADHSPWYIRAASEEVKKESYARVPHTCPAVEGAERDAYEAILRAIGPDVSERTKDEIGRALMAFTLEAKRATIAFRNALQDVIAEKQSAKPV